MRFGVFIFLFIFLFMARHTEGSMHPDMYLNTVQLIGKYGYPVEVHEVVTADGYLLTMFRIPHGRRGYGVKRKPILLMHGLFGQSENFIVAGMVNASMAYFFADNGYDVWLGNARGTQHSRNHTYLNPDSRKFWEFSYHEIGKYDLPAKIDYILEKTKKKKIYYVGHSQGGTIFYIMCSERPIYQKKIILASLLAPAGFMSNFRNPILLPLASMHRNFTKVLGNYLYEVPPRQIPLPKFLNIVCHERLLNDFCIAVYHILINGGDSGEFDKKMLPLIMKFVPSVSIRQPLHFAQSIASGYFRMWDYGKQHNMERYRSIEPPDYNLQYIYAPVAIYYSQKDNLVYPKDVDHTSAVLPNVVRKYLMPNPKWTHLDFIFSINGQKKLQVPMLELMEKFDQKY